eukprot:999856_1
MALPSLEEARTAGLRDIKSGGWKYLQLLEQESVNKPRDVVLIGKQLLENNWISSSNRWRLLERVTIAALELDDKQTAADCIKELTAKFTRNSNRVRILRGMFYEMIVNDIGCTIIHNQLQTQYKMDFVAHKM